MGLCFRCEYRARVLEGAAPPRFECGETSKAVRSCYMWKPVVPVIIRKSDKRDKRPILLNMFSCRVEMVRTAIGEYRMKKVKDGILVWWEPKGKKAQIEKE